MKNVLIMDMFLKKIRGLSDKALEKELEHVIEMKNDGYERINGRDTFDLLAEASVKMCDNAIRVIKEEQNKRNINSRKA